MKELEILTLHMVENLRQMAKETPIPSSMTPSTAFDSHTQTFSLLLIAATQQGLSPPKVWADGNMSS